MRFLGGFRMRLGTLGVRTRRPTRLTIFEGLVRDLPLAEVNLVPDQDDGDVDAEGTDRREPVSRDAVERVGVVDRVYGGGEGSITSALACVRRPSLTWGARRPRAKKAEWRNEDLQTMATTWALRISLTR